MIRGTTPRQVFMFNYHETIDLIKILVTYAQDDKIILEKEFTQEDLSQPQDFNCSKFYQNCDKNEMPIDIEFDEKPINEFPHKEHHFDKKHRKPLFRPIKFRRSLVFRLTQEETLLFEPGVYYVQIKGLNFDNTVVATATHRFPVLAALHEEIIS